MKNITLSVDENVLAAVRRHAAERNSTVNALVREYLTNLAAHESRASRARARLRQLSKQSQGKLGKKTRSEEGGPPAVCRTSAGMDRTVDGVSVPGY